MIIFQVRAVIKQLCLEANVPLDSFESVAATLRESRHRPVPSPRKTANTSLESSDRVEDPA